MKKTVYLTGIFLIILGITALVYQGFSYTKQENIAQIGNINVTTDTQKKVNISPVLGGISIIAGIALIFLGRRNKKY